MHPDDEPALKAAFAELHQRRREQAPSFTAMRERALRKADESRASNEPARYTPRLAWAGAACAMALAIGWAIHTARHSGPPVQSAAVTEEVENLITSIEEHLAANQGSLDYPTDLLLVESQANLLQ